MDPVLEIPGLLPLWQNAGGGDPEVRIAVIDGPADLTHPALRTARVTPSEAMVGAASSTIRSEHGTHVASVLMGVPGSAVLGVAPNCSATLYSIYNEDAYGEIEPSSQATLALAINRALADGADLINISSGQQTPTGQADRILADAVRRCADAGKLIVAAAGNDGCRCVQVPGALDSVLAVGACDLTGRPLPFSSFGDAYLENGILAPGENVKGASPTANVALRSGTSFATPIVTGIAALLLSRLRQLGREANPRTVRAALLSSAVPCDPETAATSDPRCLAGRLDIAGAVAKLLGAGQAVTNVLSPYEAHADGSRPHAGGDGAEFSQSSIQPLAAREGTMGESPMTAAPSTPVLFGPDGTPVRSSYGVSPSEAPAAPPSSPATGSATTAAPAVPTAPVAAPVAPPAAFPPHAAPAMGGVVWMPMPMTAAGSWSPGWAPVQAPAMMPSALSPPPAPAPAWAPPAAARYEGAPAVQPSAADCGGCGVRPSQQAQPTGQMAFPIGQLFYDFGKEARLDYFVQAIANWRDSLAGPPVRGDPGFGAGRDRSGDTAAPYNPEIMARYLLNLAQGEAATPSGMGNNFPDADAIIWTLTIDTIPIYAIKPLDVFGLGFYASLVLALWHQEVSRLDPGTPAPPVPAAPAAPAGEEFPPKGSITRVSMAGWADSTMTTKLLNGTVVPTLVTDWRGFYTWDLYTLLGADPAQWPAGAQGFLERIYNEFRNVGIAAQDRALNYSAMNAYNTRRIFADVAKSGLRLDTVEVDRSVICRPESDCWDVTYRFFNPTQVLTQAREVYQYTIDVSDVVPVAVGPLRQWQIY
jgi:cyanobactin maturation PatA/PatG family protease